MEKKTIGGFIAALRKAHGMTQKELAEKLNVSDKTVSRWERDDGTPDLSAIPAIEEIFGVTCDELLRGQRKSPSERSESKENSETSPRGEKQRQRLLKSTLSHYQNLTYIAMGISVVGMIVALICNLAFLKAVLGFLLGAIFYAGSVVCQAVFLNQAFVRVEDGQIEESELSGYKQNVIRYAERSLGLTVFFLGFTFPLVLVDAFMGLGADSLLFWGSMGGAVFLLVYCVVLFFLNDRLLKKGVYTLSAKEQARYIYNHRLKKKYTLILLIILAVAMAIQAFGGEMLWSPDSLVSSRGTVFHDYDSFIEYMAQDIPMESYDDHYNSGTVSIPVPEDTPRYYDENGNLITEEAALTRTIEDANGQVVCTYLHRNESVSRILYSAKDGTVLPIRVISYQEYRAAFRLFDLINLFYSLVYPLEILTILALYMKKRAK